MIVDVGEAGADRPRVRCAELQEALHDLLVDQVHRHLAVELLAEPAGEAANLGAVGRVVAKQRGLRVAFLEILRDDRGARDRSAVLVDADRDLAGGVEAPEDLAPRPTLLGAQFAVEAPLQTGRPSGWARGGPYV